MKLQAVCIIICSLSTHWSNAQNEIPNNEPSNSQFLLKAKSVLGQYSRYLQQGAFKYPYPWMEDAIEGRNMKANKVKTVKDKISRSTYDKNGGLVLNELSGELPLASQRYRSNTNDAFKRNPDGEIVLIQSAYLSNPKEVHIRQFYYAGDSLYSLWTLKGKIMGVGLSYQNIFINVALNQVTIYVYKKESLGSGYLIKELMLTEGAKEFKQLKVFQFNSADRLVGRRDSDVEEDRYLYNDNGLLIETEFYRRNELMEKVKIVRNENGLIREYLQQKGPFTKNLEPASENHIPVEYEFYAGQRQVTAKVVDTGTKGPVTDAEVAIDGTDNWMKVNAAGYVQITADDDASLVVKSPRYETAQAPVPSHGGMLIPMTRIPAFEEVRGQRSMSIFIKEAKRFLRQYSKEIQPLSFNPAHPWNQDETEKKNLSRNKVRQIRDAMFRSEYDKNGELTLDQSSDGRPCVGRECNAGFINYYQRDEAGKVVVLRSRSVNGNDLRKTIYYYSGDTIYFNWSVNEVEKILGLVYKNIFIEKVLEDKWMSVVVFNKTLLEDGYFLKERILIPIDMVGRFIKYTFNKENSMKETIDGTYRHEFNYDSNGLLIERQIYDRDKLLRLLKYKRDQNGLVRECIDQEIPPDNKAPSEKRIIYEYDYY